MVEVFCLSEADLLSPLAQSLHTLVNCGFCIDNTCSKLVEAGFWHGKQLEGDIFLKKMLLSFIIYGVFKYGILFTVALIIPLIYSV